MGSTGFQPGECTRTTYGDNKLELQRKYHGEIISSGRSMGPKDFGPLEVFRPDQIQRLPQLYPCMIETLFGAMVIRHQERKQRSHLFVSVTVLSKDS